MSEVVYFDQEQLAKKAALLDKRIPADLEEPEIAAHYGTNFAEEFVQMSALERLGVRLEMRLEYFELQLHAIGEKALGDTVAHYLEASKEFDELIEATVARCEQLLEPK